MPVRKAGFNFNTFVKKLNNKISLAIDLPFQKTLKIRRIRNSEGEISASCEFRIEKKGGEREWKKEKKKKGEVKIWSKDGRLTLTQNFCLSFHGYSITLRSGLPLLFPPWIALSPRVFSYFLQKSNANPYQSPRHKRESRVLNENQGRDIADGFLNAVIQWFTHTRV